MPHQYGLKDVACPQVKDDEETRRYEDWFANKCRVGHPSESTTYDVYLFRRALASQVYGIAVTDSSVAISMVVLLIAIALLACILPVRRASSIDPTRALAER